MGTIDRTSVKLACVKCGITETSAALQKGSSWSIGSWEDLDPFHQFDASTKQGIDGPEVTSATCKKCKAPAQIDQSMGGA